MSLYAASSASGGWILAWRRLDRRGDIIYRSTQPTLVLSGMGSV